MPRKAQEWTEAIRDEQSLGELADQWAAKVKYYCTSVCVSVKLLKVLWITCYVVSLSISISGSPVTLCLCKAPEGSLDHLLHCVSINLYLSLSVICGAMFGIEHLLFSLTHILTH